MDVQLLYFTDPMCSWCWGFSPTIHSLQETYADNISIHVILGGLKPHETRPLPDYLKAEIRKHWEHVHDASGQPFDYRFFDREGFVYNTEPACRAVATARHLDPSKTLDFLAHVQRAFYSQNLDITQENILCTLAAKFGFEPNAFAEALQSKAIKTATQNDFANAKDLGIRGFPALVGRAGTSMKLLTLGYRDRDTLDSILQQWMKSLA